MTITLLPSICAPGHWTSFCGCCQLSQALVDWKITGDDARTKIETVVEEICQKNKKILDGQEVPGDEFKLFNGQLTFKSRSVLRMRFFTPILQWVDILRLDIVGESTSLNVKARANSRGLCPASCPCALLGGILCFWLPFLDHGNNFIRLQMLKRKLEQVE